MGDVNHYDVVGDDDDDNDRQHLFTSCLAPVPLLLSACEPESPRIHYICHLFCHICHFLSYLLNSSNSSFKVSVICVMHCVPGEQMSEVGVRMCILQSKF